ncbi:HpcH/HpaI aldolase/citrate lyase family protein [Motilibacter aurantiacus]|uniref:HpcH/HpaI aldolase/citrate lyase family protein n=1 Tax=Motilibacter aurantiacus TaxID=2714955 RepID=UPI00140890A9|nr:CoA ester lyase [Motilibacter aurantiacus]NHC45705.1 CoA ester lyase [Motilibacter aurantiacus]
MAAVREFRSRRSCLSVPASNARAVAKAPSLPVDEVMLDLEDSVAEGAKAAAREAAVAALLGDGWGGRTRAVRVNGWQTPHTHRDVVAAVEGAGAALDCVVLPKCDSRDHVAALDLLLTQLERGAGLPVGRIGIEAQIESAAGLAAADAIAAGPRVEALVYGPGDMAASLGMRTVEIGAQPVGYPGADAYHYVLMRILVAARAAGVQAVDGPYVRIADVDGFRRDKARTAALGYDGAWVLHPAQVRAANEAFTPSPEEYARAEAVLAAYAAAASEPGGGRGAVLVDGQMIDEASRQVALAVVSKGRAARLASAPGAGGGDGRP